MKFDDLNLEPSLMDGLSAMNFQDMTPVQEQAIPLILEGKDIIACAQTGTGKTAAYLLPLLNKMLTDKHDEDAVNAIIMAPTRELAQQIDQQLEGFSYFLPVSSVAVYGGNDASAWDQQKKALKMGADFVIATPGRLISHISLDNVDFSKVSYFVLDEADRMLDMGFYDDIIQIVKKLPEKRQTIMFSATMPPKIQKLAESILHDPTFVNIAISKPADGIEQGAYVCYETQKLSLLTSILSEDTTYKTIVFSSSKLKVKEMARQLRRKQIQVAEIHSDLEQGERDAALLDFKNGNVTVLVATDIVSRGIDIDDIELVVNYDVPHDVEDYIHRIGRTARANRKGRGLTFISEEDQNRFYKVERFLDKVIDKLPMPSILGEGPVYQPKTVTKGNRRGRGGNIKGNNRSFSSRRNHDSQSGNQGNNHYTREGEERRNHSHREHRPMSRKPMNDGVSSEITNVSSQQEEGAHRMSPSQRHKRPFWKNRNKNNGDAHGQSEGKEI
ncbi:MAG: DEAD/DEAH box helicase [Paludibacteraceae bacterium]|nr:DEAD/DEAH box helicase [Paludibacteraceae bacterium]